MRSFKAGAEISQAVLVLGSHTAQLLMFCYCAKSWTLLLSLLKQGEAGKLKNSLN